MSGIVGIVNTNGEPVDRRLLARMTSSLRFRGPDAERVWIDGSVGFGHTLFATTDEAWTERQPCALDGDTWIVADARVDGREELVRQLRASGRECPASANDAELLLHAYGAWGEAAVDRLLGDFAFALWDGRKRRLFCARDQFGVKSFFFAEAHGHIVFSNTLDCVLLHPAVSDRLDDASVADYLLFYYRRDPRATIYEDIHRLPPGHVLSWDGTTTRVRQYWELEAKDRIRYRRPGDYVEQFTTLLTAAVADRLRTRRVSVFLSGGLDSPSVAATAKAILSTRPDGFEWRAYTAVFERLVPDDERHYAQAVADHLGIPIHFFVNDDYPLYHRCAEPDLRVPEPMDASHMASYNDMCRLAASTSRVALTGSDLDTLLLERPINYLASLVRHGRVGDAAVDLWRFARAQGGLPRIGIRYTLRDWWAKSRHTPPLPAWLNPTFAKRLNLAQAWSERAHRRTRGRHPLRRRVSGLLSSTLWAYLFEGRDAGVTRILLEQRHPFADLRLVDYLLSIPLIPWCQNKTIVRDAMRGVLPESVLARPKTPMAENPHTVLARAPEASWLDAFQPAPELLQYVDRSQIPPVTGPQGTGSSMDLRPFDLNLWLRGRQAIHHHAKVNEGSNEGDQHVEHSAIA